MKEKFERLLRLTWDEVAFERFEKPYPCWKLRVSKLVDGQKFSAVVVLDDGLLYRFVSDEDFEDYLVRSKTRELHAQLLEAVQKSPPTSALAC